MIIPDRTAIENDQRLAMDSRWPAESLILKGHCMADWPFSYIQDASIEDIKQNHPHLLQILMRGRSANHWKKWVGSAVTHPPEGEEK